MTRLLEVFLQDYTKKCSTHPSLYLVQNVSSFDLRPSYLSGSNVTFGCSLNLAPSQD